jgi:putative membrane protein (TIGR04086 family)
MRSLSIGAIIMGAVIGVLVAALISLIAWGILLQTSIDSPEDPALMAGVVIGFIGAGYAGGRLTRPSATHGMLAGLVMAFIVGAVSIASGSPAPPITIAILVLLSAVLGRLGGLLAGRR